MTNCVISSRCFIVIAAVCLALRGGYAFGADAAEREFAYAEALSQRGLDTLAVIVMEQFAANFSDHPRYEESLVTKARYQQRSGDLAGSLATAEGFLEKHSYSRLKIEALCLSAELYYDMQRWPQAAERLQALMGMKEQVSPEWLMRARYYLAWCKAETGQYEDAMNRFRDFAAICPDTDLAQEARLAVGDCLRRLGRHEEAFAAYGRVMGEASGDQAATAAYGMGLACLETAQRDPREYRRAAVAFSEVARKGPRSSLAPQSLLRKAECLAALGDKAGARACLAQVVEEFQNDPAFAQAAERLGKILVDACSAPAKEPRPLSQIEGYVLVTSQIRAGRLNEAAQALAAAWKRTDGPWALRACVSLATALDDAHEAADAATWYERAHDKAPQDPHATTWLLRAATLRQENGEDAEAARLLKDFLASHPEHPRACIAQWNLAQLHMKAGRYAEAAALLETTAVLEPPKRQEEKHEPDIRQEAIVRAGLAWTLAGEDDKAVAAFKRAELEKALETAPPQARFAYAEALARTGSVGQAVEVLRDLVTRSEGAILAWANYRLGVLCERAAAWEEAANAFAQADAPTAPAALRADALLHQAIALFRVGRPRECASALVQIMKRYPSKPLPPASYAWLAGELLRAGDVARARHVCEAMERSAGPQAAHRAFAQFLQARCDMALGNCPQAAARLRDFDAPDAALAYAAKRMLADCLRRMGEETEAEKQLHLLVAQSSGRAAAETEVALAQLALEMGRPAEAAATFRHVLLLFDTPAMRDLAAASYSGLATCEEKMGRRSQARAARAKLKAMGETKVQRPEVGVQ